MSVWNAKTAVYMMAESYQRQRGTPVAAPPDAWPSGSVPALAGPVVLLCHRVSYTERCRDVKQNTKRTKNSNNNNNNNTKRLGQPNLFSSSCPYTDCVVKRPLEVTVPGDGQQNNNSHLSKLFSAHTDYASVYCVWVR